MNVTDIFLSYNREDQPVARRYAEALRAAGFDVWWDQALRSGEAYDEVTEAALRAAKAVVVLWSPRSAASRWVRAEATIADRNKTLAPVMIEACDRPVMFELTQTADLIGWSGAADDPRFQAFIRDLHRLTGPPRHAAAAVPPAAVAASEPLPLPEKPSIAVLPFANLHGDPDQTYFVDGLMEEIISALTRIRTLFVIGSGSSLSLKGQDLTPLDAARRLGVRYVLEGSVRKAGDRVRIAAKLIDAVTSAQIWADRFDERLDDIFALQDKVALGVAGVIEFSVQNAEALRSIKRPTSDLRSYELYLRALVPFRTYTRDGVAEARGLLEQALARDPDYALALSLLAGCHAVAMQYQWSDDPAADGQMMMQLIGRSLQAGADDPQVLATAALAYWIAGEFGIAAQLADRAAILNPGSSFPLMARGQIAVASGDIDVAEDCLAQSIRLDPLSPNRNIQLMALAAVRLVQRRFAEAAQLSRESTQISQSPQSFILLVSACGHLGDSRGAQDALAKLAKLSNTAAAEIAAIQYHKPEHHALCMEGVALAEALVQPATSAA